MHFCPLIWRKLQIGTRSCVDQSPRPGPGKSSAAEDKVIPGSGEPRTCSRAPGDKSRDLSARQL